MKSSKKISPNVNNNQEIFPQSLTHNFKKKTHTPITSQSFDLKLEPQVRLLHSRIDKTSKFQIMLQGSQSEYDIESFISQPHIKYKGLLRHNKAELSFTTLDLNHNYLSGFPNLDFQKYESNLSGNLIDFKNHCLKGDFTLNKQMKTLVRKSTKSQIIKMEKYVTRSELSDSQSLNKKGKLYNY